MPMGDMLEPDVKFPCWNKVSQSFPFGKKNGIKLDIVACMDIAIHT